MVGQVISGIFNGVGAFRPIAYAAGGVMAFDMHSAGRPPAGGVCMTVAPSNLQCRFNLLKTGVLPLVLYKNFLLKRCIPS
jgi:hypothetical protein